jgi:hypothetical protein
MRHRVVSVFAFLFISICAFSQTADELVQKNIEARGGLDKIQALTSIRVVGKFTQGGVNATFGQENQRPNLVRETFSLQGMTAVQAYDGSAGWAVQPFGGRKDPMLMGEDDLRDLLIDSDFDGPLVSYQAKGNKVEFLGHDTIDGDDALRLKVTLKNGDIIYDYLDPDTYLEIRRETQEFIRGSMKENVIEYGSYKPVNGVMFPFSIASGPKNDPSSWQTITVEKIEVNTPLSPADFAVPASLKDSGKK